MPHGTVTEVIPARRAEVFALLHNYDRRLEWDTLLQASYLTDGHETAQHGAISVCKGRWYVGGIAVKTEYLSFDPPDVAAVKMVNKAPFFETFAASIRHHDLPDGSSVVEYAYNFTARPRWLRFVLHPVIRMLFENETKKRLRSLRSFFSPCGNQAN